MRQYSARPWHYQIHQFTEAAEICCVSRALTPALFTIAIIQFLIYSSAQFLEDARGVLGVPEWMLSIDSRKIKTLHNGACVQMLMHFKGPLAHQLEIDLSRLIASGRLDAPTLTIHGYVNAKRKKTLSYRACGVRDPNEKPSKKNRRIFFSRSVLIYFLSTILAKRFRSYSYGSSGTLSCAYSILITALFVFVRTILNWTDS